MSGCECERVCACVCTCVCVHVCMHVCVHGQEKYSSKLLVHHLLNELGSHCSLSVTGTCRGTAAARLAWDCAAPSSSGLRSVLFGSRK